jgi:hypothetical protein
MLRRWLRHTKNLSSIEEEVVYICETNNGETLSEEEERSVEDLVDYQEGRSESFNFQVENEKRLVEDIIYF